jgi:hypothetical protein
LQAMMATLCSDSRCWQICECAIIGWLLPLAALAQLPDSVPSLLVPCKFADRTAKQDIVPERALTVRSYMPPVASLVPSPKRAAAVKALPPDRPSLRATAGAKWRGQTLNDLAAERIFVAIIVVHEDARVQRKRSGDVSLCSLREVVDRLASAVRCHADKISASFGISWLLGSTWNIVIANTNPDGSSSAAGHRFGAAHSPIHSLS